MPDLTIPWDEVEKLKGAMKEHILKRGPSVLFRLDPHVSIVAVRVAIEQVCLEEGCSLLQTHLESVNPYVQFGAH